MNKVAVGITSGIGGCAIGSVVTYLVMDKKFKEQYEKDVKDAKEYYSSEYFKKKYGPTEEDDIQDANEPEETNKKITNKKVTIKDDVDYDRQRIIESLDYHGKYGHNNKERSQEEIDFDKAEEEVSIEENIYSPVWIVTQDEFESQEDNVEFDREDMVFIAEDDILISIEGEVYANDQLDKYHTFIDQDATDGELYICDSDYRGYYHITLYDGDYATYMSERE